MAIWTVNTNSYKLNLSPDLINRWKSKGGRFCWMKMNAGIKNKDNDDFFVSEEMDDGGEKKSVRCLKDNVQVKDSIGNTVIGHIIHWVRGPAAATPLRDWFIIIPGR